MIFHNDGLGLLTRWIGAGLVQLQHDAPISQSSSGISSKCTILATTTSWLLCSAVMRHWGEKLCNTCMLQLRKTFPSHLHDFYVFKEVTVASLLVVRTVKRKRKQRLNSPPYTKTVSNLLVVERFRAINRVDRCTCDV